MPRLDSPPPPPESLDSLAFQMSKRRHLRERISLVCAGVIVPALIAAFYRILAG